MNDLRKKFEADKNNTILRLENITKIYPGTVALHRVNLVIKKGEIHGIIGKNGAGKSTLVNIISGIIAPTEGNIYVKKRKYKSLSTNKAKKEGISIVTQTPQVIPDYSIVENLFYPNFMVSRNGLINWNKINYEAKKLKDTINFNISLESRMSDLSISQQQIVLMIKAFFLEDSQIVILDEVSTSFSKKDQIYLFEIIKKHKSEGKSIIYISHRADEILGICDQVTIFRDGKKVATKNVLSLDKESISSLIVGNEKNNKNYLNKFTSNKNKENFKQKILTVNNLRLDGYFKNISFELYKGEIIGIAGLIGSGRTEILKTICGVYQPHSGELKIGNKKMHIKNPSHALTEGIIYLPENRDKEGLITILSVRKNLNLSLLARNKKAKLINLKKEELLTEQLIKKIDIVVASPEQETNDLSGGNKQKVVLGRILAAKPIIYLLDEPTKGLDIGAKKSILRIVKEDLSKLGGTLITSPEIEDLMLICDRILVLFNGKILNTFIPEEYNEKDIYFSMQGSKH
jgi:ABC-type sugar transport system ATPase subunit